LSADILPESGRKIETNKTRNLLFDKRSRVFSMSRKFAGMDSRTSQPA